LDIEGLAQLYDTEIASILNRLVPVSTVRCSRRASDAWFNDDNSHSAKYSVMLLERNISRIKRQDPSNTAAISDTAVVWSERRRNHRVLLRQKRDTFWQAKLLWRFVDALLGRGRVTANAVHVFFDAKVAGARSLTNDTPPPVFTDAPPGCSLADFLTLSVDDINTVVRRLPDTQCASDPLPTSLLRENVDVLAPFLVELFNRSLLEGAMPTAFKSAYVTPL
jgi:hypothetical protein